MFACAATALASESADRAGASTRNAADFLARPLPSFPAVLYDCGQFPWDAKPRFARIEIGRVASLLYEHFGPLGKKIAEHGNFFVVAIEVGHDVSVEIGRSRKHFAFSRFRINEPAKDMIVLRIGTDFRQALVGAPY